MKAIFAVCLAVKKINAVLLSFCDTPLGRLALAEQNQAITAVYFDGEDLPKHQLATTPLLAEAARQLSAYFAGELRVFSVPLATRGTAFQQAVWQALQQIPYGQTRSYSDIAAALNHPNAVRAVGQANGKNPLPIFIPCHRVINANGKLGGYSGGLTIKQQLLTLERQA